MVIRMFLLIAFVAMLTGVSRADVASGPAVDSKVEPLKAILAVGDDAGKEKDFATERKDKPTIFVFVEADRWDRPMARFLKTLDEELRKNRDDVRIIAVWLTDDVQKSKDYLPKADQSLKLMQTTWTVFGGDKNGPQGWGINTDAHLTSVLVSENKVDASVGYRSLNETDVPDLIKKLKPKK